MAFLMRESALIGSVQALTSLLEASSVISERPITEATNLMALSGPAGLAILSVLMPLSMMEPEWSDSAKSMIRAIDGLQVISSFLQKAFQSFQPGKCLRRLGREFKESSLLRWASWLGI